MSSHHRSGDVPGWLRRISNKSSRCCPVCHAPMNKFNECTELNRKHQIAAGQPVGLDEIEAYMTCPDIPDEFVRAHLDAGIRMSLDI